MRDRVRRARTVHPGSSEPPIHTFVDRPSALVAALHRVDGEVVGLDVERTAAPRYHKPAALVQVGTADHAVLVDTHVMGRVPELGAFLRERTVVLHAGTNDIESLDQGDMALDDVEDTSIAASLLDLPLGLDPLLQEMLGVDLGPDKDRFQRADWEQRPLPADMADYAASDVVHLPELHALLMAELHERGRHDWYRQECDHMLAATRAATRSWTDLRGLGRLDDEQRAVARAVWERREELASDRDKAASTLLRDEVIVDLAASTPQDADDLRRRPDGRRPSRGAAAELFAALQEGLAADPEPSPTSNGSDLDNRVARDRYDAMRRARSAVAEQVGIDPGVLAPSRVLWAPVHAQPTSVEELDAALDLRPWQRELVRDALWEAHESVDAR